MSIKQNIQAIINELSHNLSLMEEDQLQELVKMILPAKHIFLAGAGRSGVAIQSFANRLMHLGKSVSVVGDITSPHSNVDNILIIGSGSGETTSLVALVNKAKSNGVKVGLLTMDPTSTISRKADKIVVLPGSSPKLKHQQDKMTSIQPMGSAFEQLLFLTFDGIVLELMTKLQETEKTMFARHADLE